MLSPSELTSLYNIISDESKNFESIANSFQKTYSKQDQFKVGITLWLLLKDNLFNLSQRLSSFYILYDMYKTDKAAKIPFLPIILESLESSKNKLEQKLLIDILEDKITYQKKTIKSYKDEESEIGTIEIPNLDEYWNTYNKSKDKFKSSVNDWIRPVIYDKGKENNTGNNNLENKSPFNLSQLTNDEVSFNYFEPNYLTYYPNNNYPFIEDEPMWIMPTLNYDFIWDFTITPVHENISFILNKIINDKEVTEEQINYVINTIESNPNILKEINFTADKFMQLIEKKDDLATKILIKISNKHFFQDYLSPFLLKDFSPNSLKVMNEVIQSVQLPKVFIKTYIKHVIGNFKNEAAKDSKVKIARLLAFFITNLVKNKHIKEENELPDEIEELFCISNEEIDNLKKIIIELKQNKK